MEQDSQIYSQGDWVVHRRYGIGQIVGIEKKRLNQTAKRFYKVRTKNSIFWFPVEHAVNSRVAPLPSRNKVKQALAVLQKPPREMGKYAKERKQRIMRVKTEGSLLAIAKLVRDLTARQSEAQLTRTEDQALKLLTDRILSAWSIRMGIEVLDARQRLYQWVTG